MNKIKKISIGLFACVAFLFFNSTQVKAQQSGYYQYYTGDHDATQYHFDFGSDPNTCPSYHLDAADVYIEADDGNGGNSYYFSLISGNPDSYFNYGGYGILHLEYGEYAILKADFSTSSGTVSKYVYFYNF